ncbi:MAG: hypothetical protein ACXWC9_04230 [Pseudobdellovibrionaceae bacterium]
MAAALRNKHKVWILFTFSFVILSCLFTNCSNGFKIDEVASVAAQQELGSTAPAPPNVPPVAEPLPNIPSLPTNPSQPAPQPEPIAMTNKPAWMAGKSLNEWIEIPNTKGAGGSTFKSFSGLALREATSEIIIGAAGGHGDGTDNRVVSLVLATDQPKWILRIGPSPVPVYDVSHYPDGTPAARHTYQNTFYIESLHRLFLFGACYVAGRAVQFLNVDAFSFEANQWDPPNTWAPMPNGSFGAVKVPGTDDVFSSALTKWSAADALAAYKAGNPGATSVFSSPIKVRTDSQIRWPLTYDKKRNQLYSLQWGDGQGYSGPTISSSRIDLATGVQTKVAIKPSAAYEQFKADRPEYGAMDYDPENDRFLFYSGIGASVGRIYVIKPTSLDEYEMSFFSTIATSILPAATQGSGVHSNFKYVPGLKGFVLLPTPDSNLFFLKTAQ